jgi:hypothetical protein
MTKFIVDDFAAIRIRQERLREYGRMLLSEKASRLAIPLNNPWAKWVADPVGFAMASIRDHGLGYHLWSKQREICEALRDHDRVAVKSCHESGKSFTAGFIPCWWIASHPHGEAEVVTSAPTFPQVKLILWKEIAKAQSRGNLPGYTNQTEWVIDSRVVAFGRKPDDHAPAAFQGHHARWMLIVFDEACGIPSSLWTSAETLIANEGGKMLAIGNPDDPNTEFGNVCEPGSGWHVITISAFDTPNFSGEDVPDDVRSRLVSCSWVEDKKRRWGEHSPLYQSKVLGEFPDVSEDSLISPRWVTAAVAREFPDDTGPNELGVDVARYGRNETVIYHRVGRRARLWGAFHQRGLMEVTGLVVQAVRDTGAKKVKVDDAGLGGGVTDRLLELKGESGHVMAGVEVVGINVGWTKVMTDKNRAQFVNLKAQLSWELRERFQDGQIALEPDDDTEAQCCAIRYDVRSDGRTHIEDKDEAEKRLSKLTGATGESGSPDRFDGLVLAFGDITVPEATSMWSVSDLYSGVAA